MLLCFSAPPCFFPLRADARGGGAAPTDAQDDFGYFNSGWSGNPEARTPHIDALVQDGVIMHRHYTFKYCSPTRSSFLSGRLPYHVNQANRAYSAVGGVDLRMTIIPEKLKSAGYQTHQIGKWHAGSSCEANLPVHRGFDSSFGYLGGSEGHFNQREGNAGAASSPVDLWVDDGPGYGQNGTYNAFMYTQHHVAIIEAAVADTPTFVYHAWQETHVPNEVPEEFTTAAIDFPLRRVYEGMAHCMDSGIGNITAALKRTGRYNTTLIVFRCAPVDTISAAGFVFVFLADHIARWHGITAPTTVGARTGYSEATTTRCVGWCAATSTLA